MTSPTHGCLVWTTAVKLCWLLLTGWHCKNSSKCYQSFFLWSCLPLNVESSFGHLLANSLWDKVEKKFIYISPITDITMQMTCRHKIPPNVLIHIWNPCRWSSSISHVCFQSVIVTCFITSPALSISMLRQGWGLPE